jgi:hypothetical protein
MKTNTPFLFGTIYPLFKQLEEIGPIIAFTKTKMDFLDIFSET